MHGITDVDKQEGRQMGWHRLTEIKADLSVDNCWLNDWDVIPEALERSGKETGFKIFVASDNDDITIGKPFNEDTYGVVTNRKFLDMIKSCSEGLVLESSGSLVGRGRTFLSFALDALKLKVEHRAFEAFLNFGNSFDKSCPVWTNTSNICTVCWNTFSANLYDTNNKAVNVKIPHTKNAPDRIDNMPDIISAAIYVQEKFVSQFKNLVAEKANDNDVLNWFTGFLVPEGSEKISTKTQNVIERLFWLYKNGNGNEGQNWSDVFSAITDYYTHESSGGSNLWKQFVSSEFGVGGTKKQAAWTAIVKTTNRDKIILRGKSF